MYERQNRENEFSFAAGPAPSITYVAQYRLCRYLDMNGVYLFSGGRALEVGLLRSGVSSKLSVGNQLVVLCMSNRAQKCK